MVSAFLVKLQSQPPFTATTYFYYLVCGVMATYGGQNGLPVFNCNSLLQEWKLD